MEFHEGESVFLKISQVIGKMRFEKSSKPSLRYVGPFEILKKVEGVAYQLALLPS